MEAHDTTEKSQPIAEHKLKVRWRSHVTGVHPLSTFMRIEVYHMFQYDAETRMYRCFYTHDPGVDLMNFMNCLNV